MKQTVLSIIVLWCYINSNAQTQDPTFQAGLFKAGTVNTLLPAGKDQFIAGGDFIEVNYQWTGSLVRLNKDGSLDPTFQPQEKLNGDIRHVLPARDQTGRMLVSGFGLHCDGDPIPPVAVLDADGIVLTSFVFPKEDVRRISKILITKDNRILVAGVDLDNRAFLIRIDWEGILDPEFQFSPFPGEIKTITELSDGKLLLGNNPNTFIDPFSIGRMARLEANGVIDSTFSISLRDLGTASSIDFFHYRNDSCIYFSSNSISRLFKINRDGEYVQDFVSLPSNHQPIAATDEEIILGGIAQISLINNDGEFPENLVLRIGENDQLDTLTTGRGFHGITRTALTLEDGSILVGGRFLRFNETIAPGLVKLQAGTFEPDPEFKPVFQSPGLIDGVVELRNGSLIVGGFFDYVDTTIQTNLAKLKPNGEHDPSFSIEIHPNFQVNTLHLLSDERIVASTTFWANGGDRSTINGFAIFKEDGTLITDSIDLQGLEISLNSTISYVVAIDANDQIYVKIPFLASDNRFGSLLRLNNQGQVDTLFFFDFSRPDRFPFVSDVLVQSDGKVIFSGQTLTYKGSTTEGLLRIDRDDNIDFDTFFNSAISNGGPGLVLSNDKLYVSEFDNSVRLGINLFKLLRDGRTDRNFKVIRMGPLPNVTSTGINNPVLLPGDRLFLDGYFGTINSEVVDPPLIFDSTGVVDSEYDLGYVGDLRNVFLSGENYFFAHGRLTSPIYPVSVGIIKYQDRTTAVREALPLVRTIQVTPNPVADHLTVQFAESSLNFPLQYRIYDSTGRQLASGLIANQYQKIPVQALVGGSYQILIMDGSRSWVGRFMKL
jgi:uncharacterized delta-60 repeat protein